MGLSLNLSQKRLVKFLFSVTFVFSSLSVKKPLTICQSCIKTFLFLKFHMLIYVANWLIDPFCEELPKEWEMLCLLIEYDKVHNAISYFARVFFNVKVWI